MLSLAENLELGMLYLRNSNSILKQLYLNHGNNQHTHSRFKPGDAGDWYSHTDRDEALAGIRWNPSDHHHHPLESKQLTWITVQTTRHLRNDSKGVPKYSTKMSKKPCPTRIGLTINMRHFHHTPTLNFGTHRILAGTRLTPHSAQICIAA